MSGTMIVTGASRGIGASIARCAGKRGYHVGVNYNTSHEDAEAVVKEIRGEGGHAISVQADVSIEEQAVRLFENVTQEFGAISALVNNAGVDREVPIADVDVEDLNWIFAVNAIGPIICAREAIRRMSTERGGAGGVIVNVSSISSLYGGLPRDVTYAASKGAVDALTLGLAREVASEGIRVCAVRPGLVLTEMFDDGMGKEAITEMAKSGVPLGRIGKPEEIAGAVLWLCSDEASYLTGAIINVSGGRELNVQSM